MRGGLCVWPATLPWVKLGPKVSIWTSKGTFTGCTSTCVSFQIILMDVMCCSPTECFWRNSLTSCSPTLMPWCLQPRSPSCSSSIHRSDNPPSPHTHTHTHMRTHTHYFWICPFPCLSTSTFIFSPPTSRDHTPQALQGGCGHLKALKHRKQQKAVYFVCVTWSLKCIGINRARSFRMHKHTHTRHTHTHTHSAYMCCLTPCSFQKPWKHFQPGPYCVPLPKPATPPPTQNT